MNFISRAFEILGLCSSRPGIRAPLYHYANSWGGGEGLDTANARSMLHPDQALTTIEEGLAEDRNVRHTALLTAHPGCKLIANIGPVSEEMANPSDFTTDTVGHWSRYYHLEDAIEGAALQKIQDVATKRAEQLHDEAELLTAVSNQFPDYDNVVTMKGANKAAIYTMIHHPLVGVKRDEIPRGDKPLEAHGYVSTIGATIGDLLMSRLERDMLKARLGAHILKEAAARTVIGRGHPGMLYLEGQMTKHGLQIVELDAA